MKQAEVQNTVEKMLRKYPYMRNYNNNELYKAFIRLFYPNEIFENIYDNFKLYGMPPIESVPRARRYLVKRYPELVGDEEIEKARAEKEKEMHVFYGRRSYWK